MNEQTHPMTIDELATLLDRATVTKAYSGAKGCMCGCRGKYTETAGMIRRYLTNAVTRADYYGSDILTDGNHVWVEDDCGSRGRMYCFYLTKD